MNWRRRVPRALQLPATGLIGLRGRPVWPYNVCGDTTGQTSLAMARRAGAVYAACDGYLTRKRTGCRRSSPRVRTLAARSGPTTRTWPRDESYVSRFSSTSEVWVGRTLLGYQSDTACDPGRAACAFQHRHGEPDGGYETGGLDNTLVVAYLSMTLHNNASPPVPALTPPAPVDRY